ncbi:PD40 domain-containing protein [Candidatus Pacearchaeota archaeon]|nr:PD40 domain-containing protein [Candidatus Pacearchaeota archaeon]
MRLDELLKKGKRISRNALVTTLTSSLLFSTCSNKSTGPEPPNYPTITQTINNSKDNTLTLGNYELFIPKGSTDSATTITFSVPPRDSYVKDINPAFPSGNISLEFDKSPKSTIIAKFPNPNLNVPSGVGIVFNKRDSAYSILEGDVEGAEAVVSLPFSSGLQKSSSESAENSLNGLISLIIKYNSSPPACFQNINLTGNVSSMVLSDEPIAVLVHGLSSNPSTFEQITSTGESTHHDMNLLYNDRVLLFQYPSGKHVQENADSLYNRLNREIFSKNSKIAVDLIGHSMGGVLARYVELNHPNKIRNLITLGSPHNGTVKDEEIRGIDYALGNSLSLEIFLSMQGVFTDGAKDLYKNSDLLNLMNKSNRSTSTAYFTIAGTKGKIWSDLIDGSNPDDGFIPVSSADMQNPAFPSTRERPVRLESKLVNLDHEGLAKGSTEVFISVADFVREPTHPHPLLIASPKKGEAPLEVLLDASASEPHEYITSYEFNFKDGSPFYKETRANAPDGLFDGKTKHVYQITGTYLPFVVVSNSSGDFSYAKDTVIVEEKTLEGKIAFSSVRQGNAYIFSINPDGSSEVNLTENLGLWAISPSWSPDASKIVFSATNSHNHNIWIMNADGSDKTQLTSSSMQETEPAFSPNGARIAYSAAYVSGYEQILIMNSDGSNPQAVTTDYDHYYWSVDWSPNSSNLVFVSNRDGDEHGEIYTIRLDGTNVRRLTNNSAYDVAPSYSPDGRKIALSSDRTGNYEIFLMNADGSSPIDISNSPNTNEGSPSFSKDGKFIVYSSVPVGSQSSYSEIWIMNADGTGQKRITNNYYDDDEPDWSK